MIELAATLPGLGPSWVTAAVALLGATGLGSIIVVLVKGRIQRRNLDAKADLTDAERESFTVKSARELMDDMRKDIKDLRLRIDDCEDDRKELHGLHEASARSLAIANKRIDSLESFNTILLERLKRNGLSVSMEVQ